MPGLHTNVNIFSIAGPDGETREGLPEVHEGDHGRGHPAQDVPGV